VIVDYIDGHRKEFGVEPICRVLTAAGVKIAPSTYYAARSRPLSARAMRDVVLKTILMALWVTNRKAYGAHKLWKAACREGHDIGRDQVARLMRELGIEGISRRRKKVFTTVADPDAWRAPDLVNRDFTADRPDALWVTEATASESGKSITFWLKNLNTSNYIYKVETRRAVGKLTSPAQLC
jgi:putative transposase